MSSEPPTAPTAPTSSATTTPALDSTTDATSTTLPIVELDATVLVPVPVEAEILATLPVGSGQRQLGLENCAECDPGRPWNPLVDSTGRVIIADTINQRWVIIDGALTTAVPYPADTTIVGVALGPDDVVYALVVRSGEHRLEAYDTTALDEPLMSEPTQQHLFGVISFSGEFVSVRLTTTQHFPLVRGTSTAPRVTPDFLAQPPELTATFDDGHRTHWTLPTDLSPILPVGLDNGSVVIQGGTVPGQLVIVELTTDGRAGAALLQTTNDAFNNAMSVDTRGVVVLELDSQQQMWTVLRYPLPLFGTIGGQLSEV